MGSLFIRRNSIRINECKFIACPKAWKVNKTKFIIIYLPWLGSVSCVVDVVGKGLGVEMCCDKTVVEGWVTTSVPTPELLAVYGDKWLRVMAVFAEVDHGFLPPHSILLFAEIVRKVMMQSETHFYISAFFYSQCLSSIHDWNLGPIYLRSVCQDFNMGEVI